MALPTTAIPTTNLDGSSDSPNSAREDLLALVQGYNSLIAMFGEAAGLATLDVDGYLSSTVLSGDTLIDVLTSVDGAGSGLDADLLDGLQATAFLRADGTTAGLTAETNGHFLARATTVNNARARALTIGAGNTPSATTTGYGAELRVVLGNAAGTTVNAGSLAWDWTDATNASEDSACVLSHMTAGSLVEGLRLVGRKLQLIEQATPSGTPPSGSWWIYAKATGLAVMDDGGVETVLGGSSGTDHGGLTGLADDDHTQYLRTDGSRVLTGELQTGAYSLLTTDLGADPTAPSAGQVRLYTKGGQLYYRSSSGVVGPIITGGVTDHGALTGLGDDDHTQYLLKQPTGDVVINDSGGDFNFRIEGDTAPDLFSIDAGFNSIAINTTPDSTSRLTILGGSGYQGIAISSLGNHALVADATTGRAISATGENQVVYASRVSDPGTATLALMRLEDASTTGFRVLDVDGVAGAALLRARVGSVEALSIQATEVVVNEGGAAAMDLRVEGDTLTNLLFVDASADVVNVNGSASTGRLNVTGGTKDAIYATASATGKAGVIAETTDTSTTYALIARATALTGLAGGALMQSVRGQTLQVTKDLQGQSPSSLYVMGLQQVGAGDWAAGLRIDIEGSGDYLIGALGGSTTLRLPNGGWMECAEQGSDPATPAFQSRGIFCKSDGWYDIDDAGVVTKIGTGTGGGVVTAASGTEREPDHFEETVTLTNGAATIDTSALIPAGCIVERVLVETQTTAVAYNVGIVGDETRWGENISGTAGGSNATDNTFPAPTPNYGAQAVRFTRYGGGNFNGGTVRVTVFFIRFTLA